MGAIVPLAMAWIGDVVPYERRQPVLARFLIGHMLGIAASTSAAGWLGTLPVFAVAAAGLPVLALEFRRRLAAHRLT